MRRRKRGKEAQNNGNAIVITHDQTVINENDGKMGPNKD
jgi:hypothetical protein